MPPKRSGTSATSKATKKRTNKSTSNGSTTAKRGRKDDSAVVSTPTLSSNFSPNDDIVNILKGLLYAVYCLLFKLLI